MKQDFPIKIKDTTIMYRDIYNLLRRGKLNDAIELIITKSNCTKEEAQELIDDIKHMKELEGKPVKPISQLQQEYKDSITSNEYTPKCPTCQSPNIKKISGGAKMLGALGFGLFSKTARSQFECLNCGYKF